MTNFIDHTVKNVTLNITSLEFFVKDVARVGQKVNKIEQR